MTLFNNKYRIEPARLKGFDYSSNAAYFVTICTKNRINYFGNIVETDNYPSLQATPIGQIAIDFWQQIPQHFPFVILDSFVVMPNHIHGIILINKPISNETNVIVQQNQFGQQSQNLASIIRGFKSSVKRMANDNHISFEWQPRYWDRIIRDELEFLNIKTYIHNNPQNWLNDEHFAP